MNAIRNAMFRRIRPVFLLLAICLAADSVFPASDEWEYVTLPGDTLIGIAQRHLTDPQAWPRIQLRNRIADPYRMRTGKRLKIPVGLLRVEPVAVEVLMVNGQASRIPAGGRTDDTLHAGALLHVGDRVHVTAESNLSLRFSDGSRLLVLENSRFTLNRAVRLGATGMHRIQIDLSEGRTESSIAPTPAGASRYEIRTPALRMAVRGTRFRAASDRRSGQTYSEVLAGQVKVGGSGKSILLDAGFGSYATPGEPPQIPRRLPSAPALLDPQKRYERLPLRFEWTPVQTALGYRAQILDTAANMILERVAQEPSIRWADLPDGLYVLRVRSIGADHLEGLDAEHAFTLKARPEPPFTGDPTGKAHGESTQFNWTEAMGIAGYHFQLASDDSFGQLLADEPALSASRITRKLPPGQYYWRVASVDARGDHGPFGDIVAFEQRAVPAAPQSEAPEIGDDRLHFRWRAGEPGQRYLLQLAKTTGFEELLFEQTTDKAAVAMPRPTAGEYFMRVKAIDRDGFSGPFGASQRIVVPGTSGWWWLLLLLPLAL